MIALIQQFIRISSTSGNERAIADFVFQKTRQIGAKRLGNNIIWQGDSRPQRPTIALGGHLDTVPFTADKWSITHPLQPLIKGDRLYGRGACDMKSGSGILLDMLLQQDFGERYNLRFFWYEKEELGVPNGVTTLIKEGFFEGVDLCIIPEPTEGLVVNGVFGNLDARVTASGKSIHSAYPLLGDNAIYRLIPVLEKIRDYPCTEVEGVQEALSANTIRGGKAINVVPDHVELELDYRFHPEKSEGEVLDLLQSLEDDHITTEVIGLFPGVFHPVEKHPLIQRLAKLAGGNKVVPFWSDIGQLGAHGITAINFGPGSIRQAHTIDEFVELEQIQTVREVLHQFLNEAI